MHQYSSGTFFKLRKINGPKTNCPATIEDMTKSANSLSRFSSHRILWLALQRISSDPTTTAPTVSPSHHVVQITLKSVHFAKPPSESDVTPMVALTVLLTTPAKIANLTVSCTDSKHFRPFANLDTR